MRRVGLVLAVIAVALVLIPSPATAQSEQPTLGCIPTAGTPFAAGISGPLQSPNDAVVLLQPLPVAQIIATTNDVSSDGLTTFHSEVAPGFYDVAFLGHGTLTLLGTLQIGNCTPTSITPGGVGVWAEGDTGSTFWDVPVTLSAPSADPVSIDWATVDTSADPRVAQAGTDFVSATGTVTFPPGETTQTIQIEILGDTLDEPPLLWGEWGLVAFSNPTNALLDTATFFGQGLFIIIDDDP